MMTGVVIHGGRRLYDVDLVGFAFFQEISAVLQGGCGSTVGPHCGYGENRVVIAKGVILVQVIIDFGVRG